MQEKDILFTDEENLLTLVDSLDQGVKDKFDAIIKRIAKDNKIKEEKVNSLGLSDNEKEIFLTYLTLKNIDVIDEEILSDDFNGLEDKNTEDNRTDIEYSDAYKKFDDSIQMYLKEIGKVLKKLLKNWLRLIFVWLFL